MGRYLIDTGLVLRHLRGHRRTVQLLRALGRRERLVVATVTRLEVHAGMKLDERFATQKLLSRLESVDLDRSIADKAGDLIAVARTGGRAMSVPDAIIAATAILHGLTLVTLNRDDFVHVSGLSLYPVTENDS